MTRGAYPAFVIQPLLLPAAIVRVMRALGSQTVKVRCSCGYTQLLETQQHGPRARCRVALKVSPRSGLYTFAATIRTASVNNPITSLRGRGHPDHKESSQLLIMEIL